MSSKDQLFVHPIHYLNSESTGKRRKIMRQTISLVCVGRNSIHAHLLQLYLEYED